MSIPVLHADEAKSEIQVPFNLTGTSLAVSINGPKAAAISRRSRCKPSPRRSLKMTEPPSCKMSAASSSTAATRALPHPHPDHGRRPRSRASRLARRTAHPADNVPQVVAPVTAYLDREPIEVLRAVLWPGYTGVYLVEVEVPATLQYGMADLVIQVAGQESNHVRVYIEP